MLTQHLNFLLQHKWENWSGLDEYADKIQGGL